ncbi:MAG: CarD family transcriptional regulator, partial [Solimonas sp.]
AHAQAAKPQAHKPAQPHPAPAAVRPATPPPQITNMADKPVVATPAAKKLLFKINELIVYPAHGVGRVVQIEEQEIAGITLELYIVDFDKEKLRLKVPTSKSEQKGMRKLADKPLIDHAMKVLKGRARVKRTMWSRRAQEYEAKINSGDLIAVAEVVRDLYRSERQPEQSYSERQLFEQALERMAREIAAVKKIDDDMAIKEIEAFLAKNAHRNTKADDAVPAEEAA